MKIEASVGTGSGGSSNEKEGTKAPNQLESKDNTSRRLAHVLGHVFGDKVMAKTKEKPLQP